MREEITGDIMEIVLIFVVIIFLFGLWGVHPRGVYWQLHDYKVRQESINAKNSYLQENIEILRAQMSQLRPEK